MATKTKIGEATTQQGSHRQPQEIEEQTPRKPDLKHNWSRLSRKIKVADPNKRGNNTYNLRVICTNCNQQMTMNLTVQNYSFYIKPEPSLSPHLFACIPTVEDPETPETAQESDQNPQN